MCTLPGPIRNRLWTIYSVEEHVIPTNDSTTYYISEILGDVVNIEGSGTVVSLEKETVSEGIGTSYHTKGSTKISMNMDNHSGWIREAQGKDLK
ncbi:MAG: DUF6263 family protein [Bacteroidota bacterium]